MTADPGAHRNNLLRIGESPCARPRHASPQPLVLRLPAPVPEPFGSVPCGKATCGPRRSTNSLKTFNFTAFLRRHRGFFPVGRRWGQWFPERQTCGSSVGEHSKTVQGLSSSAQSDELGGSDPRAATAAVALREPAPAPAVAELALSFFFQGHRTRRAQVRRQRVSLTHGSPSFGSTLDIANAVRRAVRNPWPRG
jgi:hypothetical protein